MQKKVLLHLKRKWENTFREQWDTMILEITKTVASSYSNTQAKKKKKKETNCKWDIKYSSFAIKFLG